jgi:predicted DNA-binding protein (UPF0251 family)
MSEYHIVGSYLDPATGEEVIIDPLPGYHPAILARTNGDAPLAMLIQQLAEQAATAEDARADLEASRRVCNMFLRLSAPARRGRPTRSAEPADSIPAALTAREEEAIRLYHLHYPNITAAAKADGVARSVFTRRLNKAMGKLDTIAARHRQLRALPTDKRGQVDVADIG